jgi:hypothetical protein
MRWTRRHFSRRSVSRFKLPAAARLIEASPREQGAKMAKAKNMARRAWTKDDVRQLKTMAKAKSGVRRIAKSLKRTPAATAAMASKLGVSLSMQ